MKNEKEKVKLTKWGTLQELTIILLLVIGSLPNANSGQQERSNTRSVNISILAAGRTQNNQDTERQVPSSILQFLRSMFPGGEIQVEEASLQGTATENVQEQAGTSSGAPTAEPNVTDQGVYLSNLLQQIMPYISQHTGSQQSSVPTEEANTSTQVSMFLVHC